MVWQLPSRTLPLDRPFVFGIVNVTPDSFSDGGRHDTPARAIAHAERLIAEGADGIDVGGESTRPHNAGPVPAAAEIARVVPVVAALRARHPGVVVSVDTTKAAVARAALDAGAEVVNDVAGFRLDDALPAACAAAGAAVILMHSRGAVHDMATYAHAAYGDDPVGEVIAELRASVRRAVAAGIPAARVVVDPGLGFAKRGDASIALLRALPRVAAALDRPVLVGASRKRFVGELSGVADAAARVHGSVGAAVAALARGARLFRVHDVAATRQALDVAWPVVGG